MTTSTLPAARRTVMTPGQRVILVLGVPVVLMLAAWGGYGIVRSVGQSAYTVTSAVQVTGSQLTINDDGGDLTVQGGAAAGSVRVSGTVSYDMVRPDITPAVAATRGPGGTTIGVSCPFGNCWTETVAGVPAATTVSATTNGGNMTVSGIAAPVTVSTGGGNVTATAVNGALDLSTEGGGVEGTAISTPDITANSGGGNVDLMLTTVPKDLQINSGGGNVTIELPPGSARYDLQLDGGCGQDPGAQSAVPSASGTASATWCQWVSSSVPDSASSPNVLVVSSDGGQITIS